MIDVANTRLPGDHAVQHVDIVVAPLAFGYGTYTVVLRCSCGTILRRQDNEAIASDQRVAFLAGVMMQEHVAPPGAQDPSTTVLLAAADAMRDQIIVMGQGGVPRAEWLRSPEDAAPKVLEYDEVKKAANRT